MCTIRKKSYNKDKLANQVDLRTLANSNIT